MKHIKTLIISVTMLMLFMVFGHTNAFAANQTDTLVNNAVKAGKALSDATIIGKKGNGKTIPTKEYKAALKKYNTAKAAVNKQKGSQKKANLKRLNTVNTQISRGKKYIDAITYGKNMISKKVALDKHAKSNVIDTKLITSYSSLSSYLKKYSSKFEMVYDKKTRDTLKKLYKTPAEKVIKDLKAAVTVKTAINETNSHIRSSASNSKLAAAYLNILLSIDLIPQAKFKKQLKSEVKVLNSSIPSKMKTGKFAEYILMEEQFDQLDTFISKGRSNKEVPGIYRSLNNSIKATNSTTNRASFQKRLTAIMDRLKVTTKELKGMLTKAAISKGIPPEVVKSIAITENGHLTQFKTDGDVFESKDKGYGIMQVTPMSETDNSYEWDKVRYDLAYNIEAGVDTLSKKWAYAFYSKPLMPIINNGEKNILENWYFAIMAYNALSTKNDPNTKSNLYQLKVYDNMKKHTNMSPEILNKKLVVFSGNPPVLNKTGVKTTKKTKSTQLFKKNNQIKLSTKTKFRLAPTTKSAEKYFPKGAKVTILSEPIEDDHSANLFTWYKVSVSGTKGIWYVASSNLQ